MTAPERQRLGTPRLHLRATTSTSDRARELAQRGAPHGTIVSTAEQSAGRGRQGRTWSAPSGQALLFSLVLRRWPALLPLAAAVAVADAVGPQAQIKWPNDVHVDGRKVAGILAEGRPQEGWAVLGVGINVAVRLEELPAELHGTAGTLGRGPEDVEAVLAAVLDSLDRAVALEPPALLDAWRARDALLGCEIRWAGGAGTAAGVDDAGRLVVTLPSGGTTALEAGEVHLEDIR